MTKDERERLYLEQLEWKYWNDDFFGETEDPALRKDDYE